MYLLRKLSIRLAELFGRRRLEVEMAEEMRQHIEQRVQEKMADGLSLDEARDAAKREFGGIAQVQEQCRDERSVIWLEQIAKDFQFAARSLQKAPAFTFATILILGIGIGANATLFSWIRPFLFDLLPGATDPGRIVAVESRAETGNDLSEPLTTSFLDFTDLRDHLKQIDVVGLSRGVFSVGLNRGAESTWCELVSGNFFDVLGLQPKLGRFFSRAEQTDAQNASPVAIISYSYWTAKYGADPTAIGSTLLINQISFTIIGVAPERFQGTQTGFTYQIWLPLTMYGAVTHTGTWMLQDRHTRNFTMLGRLKPGVSIGQASSEVTSWVRLMAKRNAEDIGVGASVLPLAQWHFGSQANLLQPMALLMAASTVLLLIVCANVANLQLIRSTYRQKEFSIRLALGSSRERLARLLLIESIVLTATAAFLGFVCAQWLGGTLHWLLPAVAVPEFTLHPLASGVQIYTLGLALIVAFSTGGAPALYAVRSNLNETLGQQGRNNTASVGVSRVRGLLVIMEVALAVVALVGAAAVLASFRDLRSIHPGFTPEGQILAEFNLSTAGYNAAQADSFYQRMTERLREGIGVTAVSYADTVPLGFNEGNWEEVQVEGYQPMSGENMKVGRNLVGPGYFEVMKIRLVLGRDFDLRDDPKAPAVMIVTEEFARRFVPQGSVLGRKVRGWGRWFTIIGVVKDIKLHRLSEAPRPFFYIPIRQVYRPEYGLTFHVRSERNTAEALADVRRVAIAVDPALLLFDEQPMSEYIAGSLYGLKVAATLLCVLGGVGILLATLGLYSVTAFSVAQRTSEIAIRLALGAQPTDLLALLFSELMRITIAGLILGSIVAALLVRVASTFMIDFRPANPFVYLATAGFTIALAAIALVIPASRALRIEPIIALRHE